ncbi:class I SAM-dependent methyltransferase [Leptolyngbya sp. FACHB-671]|uniref:class I SAM-dependent methyltransferase n=1 Tax=Leptolyngbya sp. FACHB-671 TaxID=2692812 RepID=UPI001683A51C|nr:class I SAM-dependent methyltransferase [Leptolyngbya sp. FACHB-671]MBD2069783.1 class I SAM-dependent methyltransferase [Leptolyngbya sp. FACHB-671]
MAVRSDTLFERFLAPIFKNFLIDREALTQFYKSIDWEAESDRLRQPDLQYPDYYRSQNFHSIQNGYLNVDAAVSYDPITQYVLPPNEAIVRQGLIQRIQSKPRRILDLGCGTGSTTLLLKQAFPQAEVVGLDLSPYMLVVADHKARNAKLDIQFQHGKAEQTGFPDASFDLVTASLLFHETPPAISREILRECFRLLKVGGEVAILDGNQATLRQTAWLTEIFEEPYIKDYAAGSVDAWMGAAGFGAVQTEDIWWVQQVTRGVKPILGTAEPVRYSEWEEGDRQWAMG